MGGQGGPSFTSAKDTTIAQGNTVVVITADIVSVTVTPSDGPGTPVTTVISRVTGAPE